MHGVAIDEPHPRLRIEGHQHVQGVQIAVDVPVIVKQREELGELGHEPEACRDVVVVRATDSAVMPVARGRAQHLQVEGLATARAPAASGTKS